MVDGWAEVVCTPWRLTRMQPAQTPNLHQSQRGMLDQDNSAESHVRAKQGRFSTATHYAPCTLKRRQPHASHAVMAWPLTTLISLSIHHLTGAVFGVLAS